MKYAKVESGVVVQIQPYSEAGFIECPDDVVCGYEHDGTNFAAPAPAAKTWDEVRALQRSMIVMHQDLIEIYEREVAHTATVPPYSNGMDDSKYQEWLSYFQTIRQNDEELHATPEAAIAALESLSEPVTTGYNA